MRARQRAVFGAATGALVVVLAACGSSGTKSSGGGIYGGGGNTTTAAKQSSSQSTARRGNYYTSAPTAATTAPSSTAASVGVSMTKLGDILVDGKGMTLYVFDGDTTAGKSSCNGCCASIWPPLVATGSETYAAGLSASMFSVVTRDDGSEQLAVNGKPLYLFASDKKPGDTTGQGVGTFYVVGKDGNKIG